MPRWLLDGSGDQLPLTGLGQLGAVGGVLLVLLWLMWHIYARERDRADANETEIRRLNQLIQDKYVPSLEKSSNALIESNHLLSIYRQALERGLSP